jgi:hypothetical protein
MFHGILLRRRPNLTADGKCCPPRPASVCVVLHPRTQRLLRLGDQRADIRPTLNIRFLIIDRENSGRVYAIVYLILSTFVFLVTLTAYSYFWGPLKFLCRFLSFFFLYCFALIILLVYYGSLDDLSHVSLWLLYDHQPGG